MAIATQTVLAWTYCVVHHDWLIPKPHHVWRFRSWDQFCVRDSYHNYQLGHFLFLILFVLGYLFDFFQWLECQWFPIIARLFVSFFVWLKKLLCSRMHKCFLFVLTLSPPSFSTKPSLSPLSSPLSHTPNSVTLISLLFLSFFLFYFTWLST